MNLVLELVHDIIAHSHNFCHPALHTHDRLLRKDKQAASRNSLASGNLPGLEVPFPCPGSSAFLSFLSITDFTQERVLVTSEATAG